MEKLGVDHEETVAALQQQLEEAKQAVEGKSLSGRHGSPGS